MMRTSFLFLAVLTAIVPVNAAQVWTAELIPPSGDLTAPAGAKTGWGYTIHNDDDTLWLAPWNLTTDTFEHGTPNGLFLFPVLSPGQTLTVPYDGVDGLYEFTWDAVVPALFSNIGSFTISADWYTDDPFGAGLFSAAAPDVELAYSVSLETAVPEPGSWLLLAAGGAMLAARARRRSATRTR
jgi:hypothetical protein